MKWIKCADELPKRGKFVLVKLYAIDKEEDILEMRRTLFGDWKTKSGMTRYMSENHLWRKL